MNLFLYENIIARSPGTIPREEGPTDLCLTLRLTSNKILGIPNVLENCLRTGFKLADAKTRQESFQFLRICLVDDKWPKLTGTRTSGLSTSAFVSFLRHPFSFVFFHIMLYASEKKNGS